MPNITAWFVLNLLLVCLLMLFSISIKFAKSAYIFGQMMNIFLKIFFILITELIPFKNTVLQKIFTNKFEKKCEQMAGIKNYIIANFVKRITFFDVHELPLPNVSLSFRQTLQCLLIIMETACWIKFTSTVKYESVGSTLLNKTLCGHEENWIEFNRASTQRTHSVDKAFYCENDMTQRVCCNIQSQNIN